MAFSTFKHVARKVTAMQLTPVTQAKVATLLSQEAASRKLSKLTVAYDEALQQFSFVFRYLNQSTESTLNQGDYLINENGSNFVAKTANEFLADYISTEGDIDPSVVQTIDQSLLKYINQKYPAMGITSVKDLTPANLKTIVEDCVDKYNAVTNTVTIDFSDCAITEPFGLSEILNAFPKASYTNEDTRYILSFKNTSTDTPNVFNFIGLSILIGELKRTKEYLLNRISLVDLSGTPSAVTPSVDKMQWQSFVIDVIRQTGIERGDFVKK